ncbi:MAG: nucleotidyltransferase, partial [Bacteroidetes bacterium]
MEYDKESILKVLSSNSVVIKKYGAKRIGLFGSYVRNEQKENSDIDFIVEFEKEKKTY